jgi:uncharacterized protein
MVPDLEAMLRLNEIDTDIYNLRQANRALPQRLQELTQALEASEKEALAVRESVKTLGTEKAALEIQLQELQQQAEHSQKKLESIKTNKEYDAVHQELASLKIQTGQTETKILESLEQAEKMQKEAEAKEAALKTLQEGSSAEIAKCREELGRIESQIAGKAKDREAYLPKISGRFLSAYQRLRKNAKRASCVGVVYDVPEHPRCSYCSITLPPMAFNVVKRNSALTLCENCGAVLIWVPGKPPVAGADRHEVKKKPSPQKP